MKFIFYAYLIQGHAQEIAEIKKAERLQKQKLSEERKAAVKKEKKLSQKEQLMARKKGKRCFN